MTPVIILLWIIKVLFKPDFSSTCANSCWLLHDNHIFCRLQIYFIWRVCLVILWWPFILFPCLLVPKVSLMFLFYNVNLHEKNVKMGIISQVLHYIIWFSHTKYTLYMIFTYIFCILFCLLRGSSPKFIWFMLQMTCSLSNQENELKFNS